MTYSERIRHPSGALGEREERRKTFWLLFVLGGVLAIAVYLLLIRKPGSTLRIPGAISNPNGWQ